MDFSDSDGSNRDYLAHENLLKQKAEFEDRDIELFDSLRYQFPDMSITDIIVCRKIFQTEYEEVPRHYEEIVARLENERLGGIPEGLWTEFLVDSKGGGGGQSVFEIEEEAAHMLYVALRDRGRAFLEGLKIFPNGEVDVKRAMFHAYKHGYIVYKAAEWGSGKDPVTGDNIFMPIVDVELREDISDALAGSSLAIDMPPDYELKSQEEEEEYWQKFIAEHCPRLGK